MICNFKIKTGEAQLDWRHSCLQSSFNILCHIKRDMMGSLMVTKHARWRVLSVGAGLARAVENYKG